MFAVDAHVQKYGWRSSVAASNSMEGAVFAGTTNESKRLEAVKINLLNAPEGLTINYRTHVQKYGWLDWVSAGEVSGTQHESKRIEAIESSVSGSKAVDYVVMYRAHVQKYGWLDWVTASDSKSRNQSEPDAGRFAGTTHESKRVEAIEVVILSKTDSELLKVKEDAIKELRNTFNPADYTINAEEFNAQMEKAIAAINNSNSLDAIKLALYYAKGSAASYGVGKVLNDTDQKALADESRKGKIGAIEGALAPLKVAISGNSSRTQYYDEATINAAIESAKDAINEAKVYTDAEIQKVADAELVKIYEATKGVVIKQLDDFYKNGLTATAKSAKVLKEDVYETNSENLAGAKFTAAVPASQDFTNLINYYENLYTSASTLDAIRTEMKTELTGANFLTKSSGLATEFGENEQGENVKTRTGKAIVESAKYSALVEDYVNSEAESLDDMTYQQILSEVEVAKKTVLKTIQSYISKTLNATVSITSEATKHPLQSEIDGDSALQALLHSTKVEDLERLITYYEALCDTLYVAD